LGEGQIRSPDVNELAVDPRPQSDEPPAPEQALAPAPSAGIAGAPEPLSPGDARPGQGKASESQVRATARRRARFGRRLAAAVWKDPFRILPSDRAVVRFLRGFLLPIALLRSTLGDPDRRRLWFKVTAVQTLVVVTIGAAIGLQASAAELHRFAVGENGKLTVDMTGLAGGVGLFVALSYVEWCVIALSRQYHDAISREASLAVGVPPEDPPIVPRVAIDLRWVINKGKRRWRSFKAWLGGLPPLLVFALIPWAGDFMFRVLLLAWTAFWIACGVSAKTAYAWRSESEPSAGEPYYLRTASRMTTDVPLFRWWLPRLYLRIWRWLTHGLYPPVREVELRGPEFAGLALARLVFGLPVIYLFLRPFFPVAAADLILRGLAAPRGEGARISRPSLGALDRLDRLNGLVVTPSSREAAAVAAHRDDNAD
jgi:hypothetical protein